MSPTPHVLILDHSINADVYKPFDHWRRAFGDGIRMTRIARDQPAPGLEGFTHIVVSGSEASIVDDEPWVPPRLALVREAADRGLAILGSCHGHQLVALALGGGVGRARVPEMGWFPLETVPGETMFRDAEQPLWVFASHFDEVTRVPDGFVVTARSEDCRIHGFRHPTRPIWGVQAHPEIDPATGAVLIDAFFSLEPTKCAAVAVRRPERDTGWIRHLADEFLAARAV
jgi:GMP synthase-like glutamine amidotransferase